MKMLSKFFTIILCLELIVSPIMPSLSSFGQKAFAQQDCGAGRQFDSTLNRCLTTAQAAKVMNATMNCPQGDVECYRTNAQNAFQEKVNAGEAPERGKGASGFMSKITNIAAIAGPVTFAAIGTSVTGAKCASKSFYGMVAAAAALVIGDNLANYQHKKRLKQIKEDWGKIVNPEQANGDKDKIRETNIEAQSQAFEMLARAEDSLASAAKLKQKFFLVASIAYGVTAAMSAMEIFKNKSLKAAAIKAAGSVDTAVAVQPASPADPLALSASAAVKTAAGKDEARAAAVPVPGVAETQEVATLTTIHGSSKAMVAADNGAKSALATANAAQPVAAPLVAKLTGLTTATTAATAASNAWATHTQTIRCIPIGAPVGMLDADETKGIYAYYTGGKSLDIRSELQLQYNLENSEDLASFIINKKALDGELNSPLEEYEDYKEAFSDLNEDKTIFKMFKETSLALLHLMNPLPSAVAREEARENDRLMEADGGAGGGGGSTGNSNNVDTNAAKAYKEDKAKGIDLLSIGLGVGAGVLLATQKSIGAKLIRSEGRLIFSGLMAFMTYRMSKHAGSQAEASEKRAELLRKMKEEFNSAAGAVYVCKSEDRNDPGKPNCYCYTPENQRNPNRGSSQVCQNLWAGKSLNATNYLAAGNTNSRICISNQNKADPTCACKQTKTCMKVGMSGISGLNPGSMSVLSTGLAPINGIANGSLDAANLDTASLENAASRLNKLNEKLAPKAIGSKKARDKAEKRLKSDLTIGASKLGASSLLGSSGTSNLPSNPGEAARMLEAELESSSTPMGFGGGAGTLAAPTNQVPEPGFEFGLTPDQLAAQETQIAELMKEDLDYGGNDINQGSNANIFEVLSNRYQRSGMRRLFDDEGKTKADKPAESDIIQ